jgi:threonine dehydrogenase-like Zn-dependent dehydrogenase
MATTASLPATHKALVQEGKGQPLIVKDQATLCATPGSAVVKCLSVPIISYTREVLDGTRPTYAYPTPFVPGPSVISRVIVAGADAVKLKQGDLVFVNSVVRGRDDEEEIFLLGLTHTGTAGTKKLMEGEWRNGTFAEYAKVPLENCYVLNETRLCRELGYDIDQLGWILKGLVPYGGFRSINLLPGESVIIAPATGGFGSAAVIVALAMGARVVAMARKPEELEKIKALAPNRIETIPITGNVEDELAALKKLGRINAFLDISPATAQNSTHFKSAILSLARGGRVSLMGGLEDDLPVPHRFIMRRDILLKGKWMYSREDAVSFVQLFESGILNFKDLVTVVGKFALADWKEALDVAFDVGGRLGQLVVFNP